MGLSRRWKTKDVLRSHALACEREKGENRGENEALRESAEGKARDGERGAGSAIAEAERATGIAPRGREI